MEVPRNEGRSTVLNLASLCEEFPDIDAELVEECLRNNKQDCELARTELYFLSGKKRPKAEVIQEEGGFILEEHKGDLFAASGSMSCLAHCVSVDMAMGKGIAVEFKKRFGGVEELKKQQKKIGACALLQRDKRFVYYLVTKVRRKRGRSDNTFGNRHSKRYFFTGKILEQAHFESLGVELD